MNSMARIFVLGCCVIGCLAGGEAPAASFPTDQVAGGQTRAIVSTPEDLFGALAARVPFIMIVKHLDMTLISDRDPGFPSTQPPTWSVAVWGNCTDPLPPATTAINVPPAYFRPNMCSISGIITPKGSLYAIYAGVKLWLSNVVLQAAPINPATLGNPAALADAATNGIMAFSAAGVWMADTICTGFLLTPLLTLSTNVTIIDSAFTSNGGTDVSFGTPDIISAPTAVAPPLVLVATGSYFCRLAFMAGVDFQKAAGFEPVYIPSELEQVETAVLANNTISCDPVSSDSGVLYAYNASAQRAPPALFADDSTPIMQLPPQTGINISYTDAVTSQPLSGLQWGSVAPSDDNIAWLQSLKALGVPGASDSNFQRIGITPSTSAGSPPLSIETSSSTSQASGAAGDGQMRGFLWSVLITCLLLFLSR